jgi:hypothetical protein
MQHTPKARPKYIQEKYSRGSNTWIPLRFVWPSRIWAMTERSHSRGRRRNRKLHASRVLRSTDFHCPRVANFRAKSSFPKLQTSKSSLTVRQNATLRRSMSREFFNSSIDESKSCSISIIQFAFWKEARSNGDRHSIRVSAVRISGLDLLKSGSPRPEGFL